MVRPNSHSLLPSATGSRDMSGDGQSALVDKLGVSPSRYRLLTGPHSSYPGIVQQAQSRSAETVVSPHHNNQCTIYIVADRLNSLSRVSVLVSCLNVLYQLFRLCGAKLQESMTMRDIARRYRGVSGGTKERKNCLDSQQTWNFPTGR
jgi:hypothetical protein